MAHNCLPLAIVGHPAPYHTRHTLSLALHHWLPGFAAERLSPAKYRINGVVVNIPEFGQAFGCKAGQPMVKASDKVCRVW